MGNSSSQLSSTTQATTTINSLQHLSESDRQYNDVLLSHISRDLPHHIFERKLTPSSGRFSFCYKIRHQESGAVCVLKCVLLEVDSKLRLEKQEKELRNLLEIQKDCSHLASYQAWALGSSSFSITNQNNRILKPIYLVRPHLYSTLSSRIVTRPFLSSGEKMFIAHQIIEAIGQLHARDCFHGHLTCDNIAMTSWYHVVLVDILPEEGGRPTYLAQDDLSDYIYYFQERGKGHVKEDAAPSLSRDKAVSNTSKGDGTSGEKRCYIAPERFVKKEKGNSSTSNKKLTAAMDIFSLGCILMELFLNGGSAMDLGDLMEYKQHGDDISKHSSLPQRLNKIESRDMRACCKHMLHLDPEKRLSAREYLARLTSEHNTNEKTDDASSPNYAPFPKCHENVFFPLLKRVHTEVQSPDARITLASIQYSKVILETVGIHDKEGEKFFNNVVGTAALGMQDKNMKKDSIGYIPLKSDMMNSTEDVSCMVWSNTIDKFNCDELLARTERLLKEIEQNSSYESPRKEKEVENRDFNIFNNAIDAKFQLSSGKTPSSAALIIFVQFVLGNIRHAQRPTSRLVGIQLLLRVASFTSDQVRLQRIVPTLISITNDSDASVRSMAVTVLTKVLAMVDHFPPSDANIFPKYILKRIQHLSTDSSIMVRLAFIESMALLAETSLRFLDTCHSQKLFESGDGNFSDNEQLLEKASNEGESMTSSSKRHTPKLFRNDYDKDLRHLQEIFARWVVVVTTDFSDESSPLKQAVLNDISKLCNFFGKDGVMTCILPQILAFLNNRKDWELRSSLCKHLPAVCTIVGRSATESFVVPCVETALIDDEEMVVVNALGCLTALVRMGLLTRAVLFGRNEVIGSGQKRGILDKYSSLLLHPFEDIRYSMCLLFATCSKTIRFPDNEVLLAPILRIFLRHDIDQDHLLNAESMMQALLSPSKYFESFDSIDFHVESSSNSEQIKERLQEYRNMKRTRKCFENKMEGFSYLHDHKIKSNMKGAYSIRVPNQKFAELITEPLPVWYEKIREIASFEGHPESPVCTLRTMSILSQVYASKIQNLPLQPQIMLKGDSIVVGLGFEDSLSNETSSDVELKSFLLEEESRLFCGATNGEWGSISSVDPISTEISQIASKLQSLEAPVVPPRLGSLQDLEGRVYSAHDYFFKQRTSDSQRRSEWKPKVDSLICSTSPFEHQGPVTRLSISEDESFFVSGSHDGTCKVFEMRQIHDSNGNLKSTLTLNDGDSSSFKINDLSIIENSHSVATANSDGCLRIWRVEVAVSRQSSLVSGSAASPFSRSSRVSGSKMIRRVEAKEGGISCISHFNTNSSSILMFTSKLGVHTWDLRCEKEPFALEHCPQYGFISSLSVGKDRNWFCTGSNTGK